MLNGSTFQRLKPYIHLVCLCNCQSPDSNTVGVCQKTFFSGCARAEMFMKRYTGDVCGDKKRRDVCGDKRLHLLEPLALEMLVRKLPLFDHF